MRPNALRRGAATARDLAGSEPSGANRDPDYTVGLLLGLDLASGEFYIVDIVRKRKAPGAVERLVRETAARDGRAVAIGIEQEPGAAGVALVERFKRQLLRGYRVYADRSPAARTCARRRLRPRPKTAWSSSYAAGTARSSSTS